jgi:hypothetical protein
MERNINGIDQQTTSMKRLSNCFMLSSLLFISCKQNMQSVALPGVITVPAIYKTIGEIPLPNGYKRMPADSNSFQKWLRGVKLKTDPRIYLYDGSVRADQSTHYAVLDMPVGDKDLQQCADAVLRLRTEYFFGEGNLDSIHYKATDGTELSFTKWLNGERYQLRGNRLAPYKATVSKASRRQQLEQFLEVVFSYCGTGSLSRDTKAIGDMKDLIIGDVFVKAAPSGHAMIVVDVAANEKGEKVFMLAQGLMPAQSIHIVKNPADPTLSPWYAVTNDSKIITPEWVFYRNQVNRW